MAKMADKYSQRLSINLAQAAANTTILSEILSGVPIFEKMAFIIHRFECTPNKSVFPLMTVAEDYIACGLTNSSTLTDVDYEDMEMICRAEWMAGSSAQPPSATNPLPYVFDFTGLPQGGILVPPKPLYWFVASAGLASVCQFGMRAYFTMRTLTTTEYWELVESIRGIV